MIPPVDLGSLPGTWFVPAEKVTGRELEDELARETAPGHELHGVDVVAVAVRKHLKDVVLWLPASRTGAWVHLTWTVETNPRWPSSVIAAKSDAMVQEAYGG